MIQKTIFLAFAVVSTYANGAVTFYDSKASFDLAATTVLIENFDIFSPVDTNIFTPIVSGIATYTALAPATNLVVTGASTIYSNFGANLTPFQGTVLSSSGPENIKVTFSSQLSAAGFDGYLNGLGAGTVKVFDDATLLGTLDLPNPTGGAKIYVGIVSDSHFNAIQWTTTGGGTLNSAIDTISVSTVPELSTASLMALGLGMLFAMSGLSSARKKSRPFH